MAQGRKYILTINSGSSSIKFALYDAVNPKERFLSGKIERIGLTKPLFKATKTDRFFTADHADYADKNLHNPRNLRNPRSISFVIRLAKTHQQASGFLLDWLQDQIGFDAVVGVGHRVVHGGPKFTQPQRITRPLLAELRRLSPYDPEHLPSGIQVMELCHQRQPKLVQVACFDTAFHRHMPRVAKLLPLPRRLDKKGVQRFGFHGLSYAYLLEALKRAAGAKVARGKIVMAHLGNGASLAAVHHGRSMDTSMGFTPAAGLPMSTRSGDLDPGLVWYLARTEGMNAKQFHEMVHHQSGLLGVSGISPDMRDLEARQRKDVRAAEAVALFCYQTRKWIGAFAAALGGLDTLVFAGGIGENSPEVRQRICEGLEFLGVRVDRMKNKASAPVISRSGSRVAVRVIRTDEELMIAKAVAEVLRRGNSQ